MSDIEPKARIPESEVPHQEPHIYTNVWITESDYDGLHALISWLRGFTSGSNQGSVPGNHALISHFRQLTHSIRAANAEKKRKEEEEAKREGKDGQT